MSRLNKARSLALESLETRETPAVVGALDPSFGTAGKVAAPGAPYTGVALQQDGKIVAVGSQGGDFLVARFNVDGTLDTTFNGSGTKKIDFGGAADAANDVAVQADGKIVVVGSTNANPADENFAIARLNADGTLDTSFDTDGKQTVDFATQNDVANAVAVASNGDIYVVGTATQNIADTAFGVARLSGTNGALITAFGNNGKQFVDFGGTADQGNGIDIALDGKIVVAGSTNAVVANGIDFAIARLDPTTGTLDATFNGTGQKTVNFGAAATDTANDVAVLADGSIIAAGFTNIGGTFDAGVAKLTPAGALDAAFDGDGLANIDFGGALDTANRVGVLQNGKIVLVGSNDADAVVARLTPAGALDTSFNGSGKTAIDFSGVDAGLAGAVTPQGRIVVAGTSTAGADGVLARLIGTVEKDTDLATGGSLNGTASVFAFDAAGKAATTAAYTTAPFSGFTGNVRVATGDVNGDGVDDVAVITGPASSGPVQFAVISGVDGKTVLIAPTDPFGNASFNGGGFVSVGDLDNDGRAEVILTPDQGGGPNVVIYSLVGTTATVRKAFLGIDDPNFRGGARTAIGDFNGDGVNDLVVAAGFLGGPRVALFDGKTVLGATPTKLINDFFAFTGSDVNTLRNGVFVAAGDINGDGFADLISGGGPGGGPRILAISGKTLLGTGTGTGVEAAQAAPLMNFFVAGNETDRGGVRLAVVDADGDNKADVVAASGEGSPSRVRIYLGSNITTSTEPTTFQDLDPYSATLAGGVFVG